MPSLRLNWPRLAVGLVLCLGIALVQAEVAVGNQTKEASPACLTLEELDGKLQVRHRHFSAFTPWRA